MSQKIAERPWGSKGAINRAGEALRIGGRPLSQGQRNALEAWRLTHNDVINAFQSLLRQRAARDKGIEVAQRLKRRLTIVDKLRRYPEMQLSRMDDVAGCRLIFPNISALTSFREELHRAKKIKHVRRNEVTKYDYIASPTNRGYRGIHDVYEYRARQNRSSACNGLLIELQYRTQLQHAWATAVEIVTQKTENEPKFNRGDQRHIRLFCLASEILARVHEQRKSCLPDLSDRQLMQEFETLDSDLAVMGMFYNLAAFKWIDDQAKSKHVILQSTKGRPLKIHAFDLLLEASTSLLELEKEFPDDDIVLVGADRVSEVTSVFRNYFDDVGEFLRLMRSASKELSGDDQPAYLT